MVWVPHEIDVVGGSLLSSVPGLGQLLTIPEGLLAIGQEAGVALHASLQSALIIAQLLRLLSVTHAH